MSWLRVRAPLPPRRKPIRRVSLVRARENKIRRRVLQDVAERDGLGCWAQRVVPHVCVGDLDGHELRSRAHLKDGHLDPENIRLLCRWAHDWVHDHPIAAFELGLLRSARLEAERDAFRDYADGQAAHFEGQQQ